MITEFEKGRRYQAAWDRMKRFQALVGDPDWLLRTRLIWDARLDGEEWAIELMVDGRAFPWGVEDHPYDDHATLANIPDPRDKAWAKVTMFCGMPIKCIAMVPSSSS